MILVDEGLHTNPLDVYTLDTIVSDYSGCFGDLCLVPRVLDTYTGIANNPRDANPALARRHKGFFVKYLLKCT